MTHLKIDNFRSVSKHGVLFLSWVFISDVRRTAKLEKHVDERDEKTRGLTKSTE